MMDLLISSDSPNITKKTIGYLLKVIERISMDEEKDPYNYVDQPVLEPTMKFEC